MVFAGNMYFYEEEERNFKLFLSWCLLEICMYIYEEEEKEFKHEEEEIEFPTI